MWAGAPTNHTTRALLSVLAMVLCNLRLLWGQRPPGEHTCGGGVGAQLWACHKGHAGASSLAPTLPQGAPPLPERVARMCSVWLAY